MKKSEASLFRRPAYGSYLLQGFLVFSLIYYAAIMVDLAIYPMVPGLDFDGSVAILDRFIEAFLGTLVLVIGIFIMRRVPTNRIGPLLIIYGVSTAGWATRQDLGSPMLTSLAHLFFGFFWTNASIVALVILLVNFPTGQIYPRQAKPWILLYAFLMAAQTILTLLAKTPGGHDPLGIGDVPLNPFLVPALVPYYNLLNGPIDLFLNSVGLIGAAVSLILRYHTAQLRERLQIKWFIWVLSIALFLIFIDQIVQTDGSYSAVTKSPLALTFLILFYGFIGTAPAIGIGLAILRSRLWEIDTIIRRTVIYSILTAILALLYFSGVVILQQFFRIVTGQSSDLTIVLSTLAIAALFNPIRLRLQRGIDRRFYRKKYDASQTLASFDRTTHYEVDIEQLTSALQSAVEETIQPEYMTIWLKESRK